MNAGRSEHEGTADVVGECVQQDLTLDQPERLGAKHVQPEHGLQATEGALDPPAAAIQLAQSGAG